MKTTTTTLCAGLMMAVMMFPGVVAEEEPPALVDVNHDWFLEQIGDAYVPEAVANTNLGPMRVDEALQLASEMFAEQGISVPSLFVPTAAGMGQFPIVTATGLGIVLEVGAGGGRLPATCASSTGELNLVSGAVPPATWFSKNGYAGSSLSKVTQVEVAAGTDILGQTADAVTNYNQDIIWGANYEALCIDFDFCFFGFCFWFIVNLGLGSGGVIQGDLGTNLFGTALY